MPAIHEAKAYGLKIRESANDGSDFSNPDADYRMLFLGEDGELHVKDSAGTVTDIGGSAGSSGELDYVAFTSNVSPTATTEATANTVVTGSSVAYDGSTVVLIEFFSPACRPDAGAAGRSMSFWLYEDGSSIGMLGQITTPAASGCVSVVHAFRRLTPSNASHTYSIRASVSAGTGLVGGGAGGAGANVPGFIRIATA